MPYDEEGRFIYPKPARKRKPKETEREAAPSRPPVTNRVKAVPPTPLEIDQPKPQPKQAEVATALAATKVEPPLPAPVSVPPSPVRPLPVTKLETPVPPSPVSQSQVLAPENPAPAVASAELKALSELDLALLWNAQSWSPEMKLATTDGQPLEVIYRGRWSGGFGPDFKGGIITLNGQLVRGDIELHLKTSDWKAHGHQRDPRYNQVILQVVLQNDSAEAAQTEEGTQPPLLALLPLFKNGTALQQAIETARTSGTRLGSLSESAGPCCERVAERHPNLEKLLAEIDELGQRRFAERALRYEAACAADSENGPIQSLWAGLLEALGYSQNKAPFRRLAEALPFVSVLELERTARRRAEPFDERVLNLEAALLGAAGLLPGQRRARKLQNAGQMALFSGTEVIEPLEDWAAGLYVDELERRWNWLERQIRATAAFTPLRERDWTFARLRPPNHPARRIAGLARLIARLPASNAADLLKWLAGKLLGGVTPEEQCRGLAAAFQVGLDDLESESGQFWARRFDFAPRAMLVGDNAKGAAVDLVGPDRAADIVVNIALPFLYGYARDQDDAVLEARALAAYRAHPKLGSNELVENVARQVFRYWLDKPGEIILSGKPVKKLTAGRLIETACRQQGLIYLHHQFCTDQDYAACPLR